jgi:hypothetical protein
MRRSGPNRGRETIVRMRMLFRAPWLLPRPALMLAQLAQLGADFSFFER